MTVLIGRLGLTAIAGQERGSGHLSAVHLLVAHFCSWLACLTRSSRRRSSSFREFAVRCEGRAWVRTKLGLMWASPVSVLSLSASIAGHRYAHSSMPARAAPTGRFAGSDQPAPPSTYCAPRVSPRRRPSHLTAQVFKDRGITSRCLWPHRFQPLRPGAVLVRWGEL